MLEKIKEEILQINKKIIDNIKQNDILKLSEEIGFIGNGGDKTKQIDKIAEEIFISHLLKYGDIYTEESGFIKSKAKNDLLFIIDPLDGSNNFSSLIPYYSTSVAIKKNKKTIFGLVYNLVTGEYFYKFENNSNIKETIKNPSIGVCEGIYNDCEIGIKLNKAGFKFRSLGSVALSIANAKNLSFVLVVSKIREFDIAAAKFLVDDLYIFQNKNFLLISKNLKTFNFIKEIINKN